MKTDRNAFLYIEDDKTDRNNRKEVDRTIRFQAGYSVAAPTARMLISEVRLGAGLTVSLDPCNPLCPEDVCAAHPAKLCSRSGTWGRLWGPVFSVTSY